MAGIKTAYSKEYYRLLLMVKSGEIGDVLSVETTCTILSEVSKISIYSAINIWSAMDPCVKKGSEDRYYSRIWWGWIFFWIRT